MSLCLCTYWAPPPAAVALIIVVFVVIVAIPKGTVLPLPQTLHYFTRHVRVRLFSIQGSNQCFPAAQLTSKPAAFDRRAGWREVELPSILQGRQAKVGAAIPSTLHARPGCKPTGKVLERWCRGIVDRGYCRLPQEVGPCCRRKCLGDYLGLGFI